MRVSTQTKKFLSLESHLLLELVVKDALVVSDEEHVWEAVLRWAAHNPDAESALAQILTYIRYPLISPVRIPFIPFYTHRRTHTRVEEFSHSWNVSHSRRATWRNTSCRIPTPSCRAWRRP
jgi:hypothetical protein